VDVEAGTDPSQSVGTCYLTLSQRQTGGVVDQKRVTVGYGTTIRTTLSGPASGTMWVTLGGWWGQSWYIAAEGSRATFSPMIFPSFRLTGLISPMIPCAGSASRIKATVSEVTGQCGGGVRLSWLGKITDAINIPAGGSRDVLLDFEVPCRPTDIEVSLIDEVRHFTVGSRIVSITPSLPDLDISDFNIPELRPEVCSGTSLVGSILIKALNCTQEVRGRIFDGTSGEVFASFGPETLNPGETIEPRFSFTVPHRMIPLKYTVERRTIEGWASVKTFSLDIKNIEPITKVGPLVAPDRMCAGIIIEPFINVIAERCPQTVRARLVDEATGEEIQPYGEIELESGGSATRKFPFRMPWKGVGIRAEVDRFDTVNEGWNRIEVVGEKIEQKTPATGVITGREVAAWARPGYPTTGSVMVRNDGECAGDIRVEGFIAEKGIMSETYTLASGESRTSVYSAMMPPIAMAGLLFRVSSMREKDFVETSSTVDVISAAGGFEKGG